jgi:hypothetical protein
VNTGPENKKSLPHAKPSAMKQAKILDLTYFFLAGFLAVFLAGFFGAAFLVIFFFGAAFLAAGFFVAIFSSFFRIEQRKSNFLNQLTPDNLCNHRNRSVREPTGTPDLVQPGSA